MPRAEPFAAPYDLVRLHAPDGPLRARIDPGGGDDPDGAARDRPAPRGGWAEPDRRAGPVRRFVARLGWRACAVAVLTVVTFVCVLDAASGRLDATPSGDGRPDSRGAVAPGPPQDPAPSGKDRIYVDSPPDGELSGGGSALPATALPAGGPYARRGTGRFEVLAGSSRVYGRGGPLQRYTVEVEVGVEVDRAAFAKAVETTLGDRHSWGGGGRMRFQRVGSGPVDFRVSLAASMTVRTLCGYTLPFETSCYNGQLRRAVINDARWVRGAVAYGSDLAAYRLYVVNHEVGHALGHGHAPCPRAGALAPVMLQQTLGLTTAGVGRCRSNPWPYP